MIRGLVNVSRMGVAFIPNKYFDYPYEKNAMRLFSMKDEGLNKPVRFLKNGGTVVLEGDWKDINTFYAHISDRGREIIPKAEGRKQYIELSRQLKQRILTLLEYTPLHTRFSDPEITAGLIGEQTIPEETPVLLPVDEAGRLADSMDTEFFVEPAGITLVVHPDVLVPRSKETISLMYRVIESCRNEMPLRPDILDMGCGSGILTIAAWQVLKNKLPYITATDILPEAVATTRLNIKRLSAQGKVDGSSVTVAHGGNLFIPVKNKKFNLIIFNAPWVTAPARNKSELALNDDGQRTIKAFLDECGSHLLPEGRVIVGYSDNSGVKAVERLESFIEGAGLRVASVLRDRIKTYRANRQWQSIYAYILTK